MDVGPPCISVCHMQHPLHLLKAEQWKHPRNQNFKTPQQFSTAWLKRFKIPPSFFKIVWNVVCSQTQNCSYLFFTKFDLIFLNLILILFFFSCPMPTSTNFNQEWPSRELWKRIQGNLYIYLQWKSSHYWRDSNKEEIGMSVYWKMELAKYPILCTYVSFKSRPIHTLNVFFWFGNIFRYFGFLLFSKLLGANFPFYSVLFCSG